MSEEEYYYSLLTTKEIDKDDSDDDDSNWSKQYTFNNIEDDFSRTITSSGIRYKIVSVTCMLSM